MRSMDDARNARAPNASVKLENGAHNAVYRPNEVQSVALVRPGNTSGRSNPGVVRSAIRKIPAQA